jgi:hypothetical protein
MTCAPIKLALQALIILIIIIATANILMLIISLVADDDDAHGNKAASTNSGIAKNGKAKNMERSHHTYRDADVNLYTFG